MPFTILITWYPGILTGHLSVVSRLFIYNPSANTGGVVVNKDYKFRYMIIPAGAAGGRVMGRPAAGYTAAELKSIPYSRIAGMFNISEKDQILWNKI